MLVADASVTLEWFLPGQLSSAAAGALSVARHSLLVVPSIWILETQNVLLKLIRQRKLTRLEAEEIRRELALMSKRIVTLGSQDAIDRVWEIANQQMMTFYDAAYVELAWQLNLPLSSSDGAVRAAASALGIRLV